MNLTEGQVADLIIRPNWGQRFMLPNYTPVNWWECDVFELSKAGYFTEYEIKLTLSDFKADANKEVRRMGTFTPEDGWKEGPLEKKHDLLSKSDPRGPVRFFYVAPTGMIPRDMLPKWAGLIEVHQHEDLGRRQYSLQEVVLPPRLHKSKIDPKVEDHARGICYYRMHRLLGELRRTSSPEELNKLTA